MILNDAVVTELKEQQRRLPREMEESYVWREKTNKLQQLDVYY